MLVALPVITCRDPLSQRLIERCDELIPIRMWVGVSNQRIKVNGVKIN